MKLTKSVIDKTKYDGDAVRQTRCIVWDEGLPGFGVRVYPGGAKAYVLSYRVKGRKRLMTIGGCGAMTIDEGRKRAKKHLVSVEDGGDPLDSKQTLAKAGTVADLAEVYLSRYAKVHKRSWRDDERRLAKYITKKWGNLKASAIKRADVATLHGSIGKDHPYEANRNVELISKMFDLGEKWGFVPGGHSNPAKGIEHYAEHKRDRWVTPEELPAIATAIDKEANIYIRSAMWLYLLTGLRKTELLRAKWEDVDSTRNELRLPQTKAGRIHYVPLSGAAVTLLDQIPRVKANPHVLVGAKEGSHLVNINKAWKRIRDDAGVADVRLHDLRRTVGSWLAQAGNSLHLIGRVLNHSTQATTAVYARFAQDHVREALEAHGKKIMGVAGKATPASVEKMRRHPKR